MVEDKYYTPQLEEFHLGFRFEFMKGDKWQKDELSNYDITSSHQMEECENFIEEIIKGIRDVRVKYLDREDIEELDWVHYSKSINDWFNWESTIRLESGHFMKFKLQIGYFDHRVRIIANEYEGANDEVFFEGYLNNYNELQKLMKQLNIQKYD